MTIRELMHTDLITIPKGTPWREAAKLLLKHKISGAPVVDEDNRIIGVVSEKDLFRALYPAYHDWYETPHAYLDFKKLECETQAAAVKPIEECMSKRLLTVTTDIPILQVGALMMATGIHRVPVVEDGKLIGMVGRRDIFRAILRECLGLGEHGDEL